MNLLTAKEVADILKISERSVRRFADRGEIPARRIGSMWRFVEKEITDWVLNVPVIDPITRKLRAERMSA
jgi:excisionase family DNA binding protein